MHFLPGMSRLTLGSDILIMTPAVCIMRGTPGWRQLRQSSSLCTWPPVLQPPIREALTEAMDTCALSLKAVGKATDGEERAGRGLAGRGRKVCGQAGGVAEGPESGWREGR